MNEKPISSRKTGQEKSLTNTTKKTDYVIKEDFDLKLYKFIRYNVRNYLRYNSLVIFHHA